MMSDTTSRWRGIAQLIFVVGLAVAGTAVVCHSEAVAKWLKFSATAPPSLLRASNGIDDVPSGKALLRKAKPDWVLVGNSMLNCRIDSDYLGSISGHRPFKVTAAATRSAVWFMFMKLMIVDSGVKPKCVTVFFRDRDLTSPEGRMDSNDEIIDLLGGRSQPEWGIVMSRYDSALNWSLPGILKNLAGGLEDLFPDEKLRNWSRGKIQKTAFKLTAFHGTTDEKVRRLELNERLSDEHWAGMAKGHGDDDAALENAAEAGDGEGGRPKGGPPVPSRPRDTDPLEFDPSPDKSFLPHMIALAKASGIKLHFHRVQRCPGLSMLGEDELRTLPEYLEQLKAYLASQGCLYSDENGDPLLTEEMYVDGSHIKRDPAHQRPFMDMFWRLVKPELGPLLGGVKTPPSATGSELQ